MFTTTAYELVTPGEIAAALGESVIRVRYVLDSRQFQPVRRAGIVRLFGPDAIDDVRQEITAIDAKRASRTEHDMGLALP